MSIIESLSERKFRSMRLGFSRYLVENYGMSMSTAYQKIRLKRVRRWELSGVERCIREYDPDYDGPINEFFSRVPNKGKFIEYMRVRGMGEYALRTHFRHFDFTEVELRGIESIYKEYKNQMEEL